MKESYFETRDQQAATHRRRSRRSRRWNEGEAGVVERDFRNQGLKQRIAQTNLDESFSRLELRLLNDGVIVSNKERSVVFFKDL